MTVDKTLSLIRSRAENCDEPTSSVIQNATISFPLAAAGSLPSRNAMGRLVRRKRKAADDDIIPEELLRTPRGGNIITISDRDLGIHIITTEGNLNMLRDAEHWFADGTFDCAPEGYQLYTTHAYQSIQ